VWPRKVSGAIELIGAFGPPAIIRSYREIVLIEEVLFLVDYAYIESMVNKS
jgi:hypothetical protein